MAPGGVIVTERFLDNKNRCFLCKEGLRKVHSHPGQWRKASGNWIRLAIHK